MQQIDERRLEDDVAYRFEYLKKFIGFGDEDAAAIRAVLVPLARSIPQIVEATYEKLLSYDATARHFLPRQQGFDGELPKSLADLNLDDPQIRFRKEHLNRYLMHLLGHAWDAKMATFLDMVGKMHTPQAGNPQIDVPLVQMNAMMGLLSDVLARTIARFDCGEETIRFATRALQKGLWIQNDFIVRHYVRART